MSDSPEVVDVLVACEVRVVAESLATLLDMDPSLDVVAYGDLESLAAVPPRANIDVVVTDDWGSGEETTQRIIRIREEWPEARVVLLGVPAKPRQILGYLQAGASAFAFRDQPAHKFVDTVIQASRGEVDCPPDVLAGIFAQVSASSHMGQADQKAAGKLTPREVEVFELLNQGFSNKEIATALQLGGQTVKNYVHNVMTKMQARSRREIVFNEPAAAE